MPVAVHLCPADMDVEWRTSQPVVCLFDETRVAARSARSVAADRGVGVVPELAMRHDIHPAVRFIPLGHAPTSPVSPVFFPHVRESLLRQSVDSAAAG